MPVSEKIVLLSIGILLLTIVVSILLFSPLELIGWQLIPSLILALYGCWMIILAGVRASSSSKPGRGAFSTFAWGLLLIATGGAWFLYTFNPIYSLAIILLVLGALAIAAAIKTK